METLSALLVICYGNPPIIGGLHSQKVSKFERWCFSLPFTVKAFEQTVGDLKRHEAYVASRQWQVSD